ncbi:phospholipase effector Tle1 domain-containing protein [Ferrimonas marina]|uniref:Uncharacterized alpha/beta hydrolase domain n=1 Tax=Ferrimonas marina TaxID=299255 RepID=A0A1M5QY87_9GAMM|nr:DUF2235 domain-containing protein [Ferrimonas marina]SHH18848.1 Uncharacterized alpha/beta hydrolase domain [Ferrimonas marina]
MKKLVICIDGVWGAPLPPSQHSAMARLARGILPSDAEGQAQVVLLLQPEGALDQAAIDRDLLQCYRFVAQNYEAGDQLFLYGFSYGAYLVRRFAAMLDVCGVMQRLHLDKSEEALRLFYQPRLREEDMESRQFRAHYALTDECRVRLLAAVDTVGQHGVPARSLSSVREWGLFQDCHLPKCVDRAVQALALDEVRGDFVPCLWSSKVETEQLWFSGNHDDLGGVGLLPGNLADSALHCLATLSEQQGLELDAALYAQLNEEDSESVMPLVDGFADYFGCEPREVVEGTALHASVSRRRRVR